MNNLIQKLKESAISTKIQQFINNRESSHRGRQRLAVYLYASGIIAGIVPMLFYFKIFEHPVMFWGNVAFWCADIIVFILYYYRRFSSSFAISLLALCVEAQLVVEIIVCSTVHINHYAPLIFVDLFLTAVTMILAAMGYLRYMPYIVSASSMVAYTYAMWITGDPFLESFWLIFAFVFLIICLLSNRVQDNVTRLELENNELRKDEQELLWTLRMNKDQIRAFIELSKAKSDNDREQFLDMIGERVRANIIDAVSKHIKQRYVEEANLKMLFPELTASEVEICALILKDKKQSEICTLLGKSATNVNSQRAHIRKKLGMKQDQSIQEIMLQRIEAYKK